MPRLWQVSVLTTTEGEDAVAHLLEEIFSRAPAVYHDEKTAGVTVTVYAEELPASSPILRADLKKRLDALPRARLNFGSLRVTIKTLRRENWAESWKRHFRPIEIDRRLLIRPGWSRRRARPGQRVVVLDPGLSFGTGQHPTTLFCLQQLVRCRKRGRKQSFLDIGTGSGILAISAAKLGYSPVVALEHDPEAVRASRQNVAANNVRVRVRRVDLRQLPRRPAARYDVICANLIATLLLEEAEKIRNLLEPGGILIVAGILRDEFGKIAETLQRFRLTFGASRVDKEWKSGQFALSNVVRHGGKRETTPPPEMSLTVAGAATTAPLRNEDCV